MEFAKIIIKNHDDLQLTLYLQDEPEENFPNDKKGSCYLKYQDTSYKIRKNVLDYSQYLFHCLENNPNTAELALKFKYATSIKAYDIAMKLLFGFKDVHIPNNEYIQILAFIEELSTSKSPILVI